MPTKKPENLELAGTGGGPLPDEVLRAKLRRAPAWVLADVEAYRETRNLPPLFSRRAAAIATKAPARQAKPTPEIASTLVFAAAPGTSHPVAIGTSFVLPEFIRPAAWRALLSSIRSGKAIIPITLGHGGKTITTTASSRVRCSVHPVAGLIVELDIVKGDPCIWDGAGVSIGFRDCLRCGAQADGKPVRVFHNLDLTHIAILPHSQGDRPAYPLARVRRCKPGQTSAARDDLVIDIGRHMQREWPSLLAMR